jgi:comEA protein
MAQPTLARSELSTFQRSAFQLVNVQLVRKEPSMILNGIRAIVMCAAVSMIGSAPVAAQEAAAPAKNTINLNTATVEQLATLPGIGPKTAERIVEYRTKSGGFKKIEELMNVKGIGEKSFLKIKPLVSAPPKTDKTSGD